MAGIKGNRRTVYTKMVIKESLIKLLQDNPIHKITVTDICREADINRGTFYNYYTDPFQLLQSIEDELFDKIISLLNECSILEEKVSVLTKIFELIKENKVFCKILLCKLGHGEVLKRIIYILDKDNLIKLGSNSSTTSVTPSKYLIRFAVSGSIGIVQGWMENDLSESPHEIAKIVYEVTTGILNNFTI